MNGEFVCAVPWNLVLHFLHAVIESYCFRTFLGNRIEVKKTRRSPNSQQRNAKTPVRFTRKLCDLVRLGTHARTRINVRRVATITSVVNLATSELGLKIILVLHFERIGSMWMKICFVRIGSGRIKWCVWMGSTYLYNYSLFLLFLPPNEVENKRFIKHSTRWRTIKNVHGIFIKLLYTSGRTVSP